MILIILNNYAVGLAIGYVLEFVYRFLKYKKIVKPLFVNSQMYGLTAAFLYFIYFLKLGILFQGLLILVFTTTVEFIVGYSYLKIKGVRLWDYSDQHFNYKGIICPTFSFYWLMVSLLYFYLVLPIFLS